MTRFLVAVLLLLGSVSALAAEPTDLDKAMAGCKWRFWATEAKSKMCGQPLQGGGKVDCSAHFTLKACYDVETRWKTTGHDATYLWWDDRMTMQEINDLMARALQ